MIFFYRSTTYYEISFVIFYEIILDDRYDIHGF